MNRTCFAGILRSKCENRQNVNEDKMVGRQMAITKVKKKSELEEQSHFLEYSPLFL